MLRGPLDASAESFDAAMRQYVNGHYRAAIPGLRAAAAARPDVAQYPFFLAICQLLDGQTTPAIAGLQQTIALGGSPYLEDAHFYIAKARLRQRDVRAARKELVWTIEQHGMLEQDARALVAQIDALTGEKGPPPTK
jgi:TolA-binding protein